MPHYLYECDKCHAPTERSCTLAEMLEWEKEPHECACNGGLRRVFKRLRHITFKEGLYENLGENPVYINNAQQLHDVATAGGNTSHYVEDFGGIFGVKKGRWI